MTDARFPERWLTDRRIQRSAAHFHAFANALLWSVANRTDGHIDHNDVSLIPGFVAGMEAEFTATGVWTATEKGWRIAEFEATQTSRDELEALEQIRASARKRKARERAAKAAGTEDVTGQSRDMSRDKGCDKSAMSRDPHRQAGKAGRTTYVSNNSSKKKDKNQPREENPPENENRDADYTPTAAERAAIEQNIRAGYES